jgi:NADH:ubiquinone oxidoreductase subunit K
MQILVESFSNELIWASYRLFYIGFAAFLINQQTPFFLLLAIDLILAGANLLLLSSIDTVDSKAIISFFILALVATESAIGLALLISHFAIYGPTSSISD